MLDHFVIASLTRAINRESAERSDARSLRHCVIASSPRVITRIGAERSDARSLRHRVIASLYDRKIATSRTVDTCFNCEPCVIASPKNRSTAHGRFALQP
jgi:hypothetical protein